MAKNLLDRLSSLVCAGVTSACTYAFCPIIAYPSNICTNLTRAPTGHAGIGLFFVVPLVILCMERIITLIRAETVLSDALCTDRLFALKAAGHVEVVSCIPV